MADSKMEQVASLFGKTIGERFTFQYGKKYDAVFYLGGFKVYGDENPFCDTDGCFLEALITGAAEIID